MDNEPGRSLKVRYLLITVLVSTLGTRGDQESCHQHGSVWTSLEHNFRTGRGSRNTHTRVCEGGPEPTCRRRPGMGGNAPGDGRPEEPREGAAPSLDPVGSACCQETGNQRRRVSTLAAPGFFSRKGTCTVVVAVARRGAVCIRVWGLSGPQWTRQSPARPCREACVPHHVPGRLALWVPVSPCVEVGPQGDAGTLGLQPWIPGWSLRSWGRAGSRVVEAPQAHAHCAHQPLREDGAAGHEPGGADSSPRLLGTSFSLRSVRCALQPRS